MSQKTKIESIVDAFQDLADWLSGDGLWKGVKTIGFLIVVTTVALTSFYVFKRINNIDEKLEVINPSAETMQTFLVETNDQNKLIDNIIEKDLLANGGDRSYLMRFHDGKRDIICH